MSYITKDGSISTAKLADLAVTQAKLAARATGTTVAAGGVAVSSASGSHNTTTSFADVTNLSVTITTTGRPVFLSLIADSANSGSSVGAYAGLFNGSASYIALKLLRDATNLGSGAVQDSSGSGAAPPGSWNHLDVVAAGTYVYKLQCAHGGANVGTVHHVKLVAYEI